ncbi:DHH family phosphoesterase [archaeon]|nr:DHH family phosphoesterase [archaeon]
MDFFEWARGIQGKVLILSHQNADLDAVCSSIAMKDALGAINPEIEIVIGVPGSISKNAKRMVDDFEIQINPSLDVELLVILDSSTLEQISPLDGDVKLAKHVAVIDHHAPHQETQEISDFYIVDDSASSTAELVFELIVGAGIEISERSRLAILVGILADSARLRLATSKTIQIFARLLESGVDYQKALLLVELPEDDISAKIACLKAASRMKIHKIDGWILVTTKVNSFEAKSANGIIALGADCVFVGSATKGEVQISARARQNFLKETGISLGRDVMPAAGESVGGSGGGHKEAAGVKSKSGNLESGLAECVKITEGLIKRRKG